MTYEMDAKGSIGFVYGTQVDSDLTGTGDMLGKSYDSKLDWLNPARIVFSDVQHMSDKGSVIWDIGSISCSALDETRVRIKGLITTGPNIRLMDFPLTLERNWKESNRYAVDTH